MVLLRASALSLLVALSCGRNDVSAFSVGPSRASSLQVGRNQAGSFARSAPVLSMAVEENDPKFISSVLKKEIAWDEKAGRFFETGFGEGDCIPDEEFCITDKENGQLIRLTLEEKERIFLDVLQSYYISGRKLLNDSEFDLLKEDLQWNGSPMVQMSAKEVKYMTAVQEYVKGTPVMPDAEFDRLKEELKEEGSKFAVQTEPKCYIDTGICKVTMKVDRFRSNLLYLPAGFVLMGFWLLFGFELIEPIIRINPVILSFLGLPWVYTGAKSITENTIFQNKLIVYGPCPNCNFQNRVYFGDILGVDGFKDSANVKCPNCKEDFTVQRNTLRASTLPKANN
jgi:hypothetical protein